jgi:hypothetical protein
MILEGHRMAKHVFSWVAGFGWTLMPLAPFQFQRVPGQPRSIVVQHFLDDGVREATVTLSDDGTSYKHELGANTQQLADVVEVIEGAAFPDWPHGAKHSHWRVETSVHSIAWPEAFALVSADAPPVFDLVGPDESQIWVQGPVAAEKVPPLDQMRGEGQTIDRQATCTGGALVELVYEHEGEPWRMFHVLVDRYAGGVAIVSAQTPETHAELVRAAVEEVATSLRPAGMGAGAP